MATASSSSSAGGAEPVAAPAEERSTFEGPAGPLEGSLALPDGTPRAVAVLCHPHPLFEGTMHNKVVHTLARTFAAAGFAALRFNFRGVGDSAGEYDEGKGETDDALAAVAVMRDRFGDLPLWIAGFSFGAYVALRASTRTACAGLVMVAPPAAKFGAAGEAAPDCPWLVVQGDADEVAPPDDVVAWVNGIDPGPELALLPGVDHFFHGKLNLLRETVSEFITDA